MATEDERVEREVEELLRNPAEGSGRGGIKRKAHDPRAVVEAAKFLAGQRSGRAGCIPIRQFRATPPGPLG